jgi:sulfur-oxidizing protein SoxZ
VGDRIRIRARVKDGVVDTQILMPHPMETGLRKDDAGAFVPAHYINHVQVTVAGRSVLEARMSIAMSRDPLLSFRFRGAREGERMTVTWTDNRGDRRIDEALITA